MFNHWKLEIQRFILWKEWFFFESERLQLNKPYNHGYISSNYQSNKDYNRNFQTDSNRNHSNNNIGVQYPNYSENQSHYSSTNNNVNGNSNNNGINNFNRENFVQNENFHQRSHLNNNR